MLYLHLHLIKQPKDNQKINLYLDQNSINIKTHNI